jgi:hypothetical protein
MHVRVVQTGDHATAEPADDAGIRADVPGYGRIIADRREHAAGYDHG